MRIRTYAKVNLFLRVLERRDDGFHQLETILQSIGLGDDISISTSEGADLEVDIRLDAGMTGKLPSARDELVRRAAEALGEKREGHAGVAISVLKRIPIGAGLGGGSANAAGVLIALDRMWNTRCAPGELRDIAASLGSDVPFCLTGGTALATGRGEDVTPLVLRARLWLVLGLSYEPVPTGAVYELWDGSGVSGDAPAAEMEGALRGGDLAGIASCLHNDLEPVATLMRPELAGQKERLVSAGALGAGVSGSGPTVFGIAEDEVHARSIAAAVDERFDRVEVVRSEPHGVVFPHR